MITSSTQQADFIDMVAGCLAKHFIEPLNKLSKERNYHTHVGNLALILDWAHDFYNQYFHQLHNWKTFKATGGKNIKADSFNNFIIAFGQENFKKFCFENGHQSVLHPFQYDAEIESM